MVAQKPAAGRQLQHLVCDLHLHAHVSQHRKAFDTWLTGDLRKNNVRVRARLLAKGGCRIFDQQLLTLPDNHLARRCREEDAQVPIPLQHGRAHLGEVAVAVIDLRYGRLRAAGDVIEELLDDDLWHAKRRHAGGERAAEVVERPRLDR